jgi:hypothetical protein
MNWGLLRELAQCHQADLLREAEAARREALCEAGHRYRLRQRLGRALIHLGGLLAGADARRAEQA